MPENTIGKRILTADDDPVILDIVERTLAGNGYDVLTAASGEQAVEIATTHHVDLVLLDYRMPGMSGIDAGTTIYRLTSRRFVLMSVHADQEMIEKAAAEGALGYLCKPLDIKELTAQINIALLRAAEFDALKASMHDLKASHDTAIAQAVDSARTVNTAIGILMERMRQPRSEAHRHLVAQARSQRRRLVDLSEEIVHAREVEYQLPQRQRGADDEGRDR